MKKRIKVHMHLGLSHLGVRTIGWKDPIKVKPGDTVELIGEDFHKTLLVTEPRDNCQGCPLTHTVSGQYYGCGVTRMTNSSVVCGLCERSRRNHKWMSYIGFQDLDKVMEEL